MTADGKFEIGDVVRCIKEPRKSEYPLELGTIATVTFTNYGSRSPTLSRRPDSLGECFRVELFELHRPFGTHRLLKRIKP